MGSDRRVQYTKKAITEAFLSLLETNPMENITVKEICCIADINRATFYRNYSDLYALCDAMEQEILAEAFPEGKQPTRVLDLLLLMRNNRTFYREVFRRNRLSPASLRIIERCKAEIRARMQSDLAPEIHDTCLRYAVHGVTGLIRDWVESGCKEDPETLAHHIDAITAQLCR